MKKILCALLAILVVFALAAGTGYGLAWYQSNHVTVGGHSYYIYETELDLTQRDMSLAEYDQLQAVLPGCKITWMVPFQGGTFSNESTSLTVTSFSQADMDLVMKYFPKLTSLEADGSKDYPVLEAFQQAKQNCKVHYRVDLGGKAVGLEELALTLKTGEYTLDALTANLKHLPKLAELTLTTPDLTLEQIEALKAAYPEKAIHCTVEILGQEYDNETTALDLSKLTSADVETVAQKLVMLPKLETVELMDAEGNSPLTPADVKNLVTLAPQVSFHYVFDFYGQQLSSDMEEVVLTKVKIGDAGEAELRTALDLMPKCKRFVLDSCGFSNEVLAKVREDYRDRTKIVWRISFASHGSCLTDVEIFRSVGYLEKNYKDVKYCEDVVYMDIGHCAELRTIEFTASMPKLKALIASGSSISDLSPLKNCTELEFLELGFCGYVDDLSPLKNCTNLRMLNIADTKVTDLKPLDDINILYFVGLRSTGKSRVSAEDQEAFIQKHPYCKTKFDGTQPYGTGWRYEEDNTTPTPYYKLLNRVFRYDQYGKESQQFGRYLSDVDPYLKDTLKDNHDFAYYLKAVEDEYSDWLAEVEAAAKAAAEAAAEDAEAEPAAQAEGGDVQTASLEETAPAETTAETASTEAAEG